jgi:hypothetical protein
MNGEAIMTVSAAVVALTQLAKWFGLSNRYGSIAVILLSVVGVALWAWSQESLPARTEFFSYFAGFIAVATSAAGVFGFTRATSEAVTKTSSPPPAPSEQP